MRGLTDREVKNLIKEEEKLQSTSTFINADAVVRSQMTSSMLKNFLSPNDYVNENVTTIESVRKYNDILNNKVYEALVQGKSYVKDKATSATDCINLGVIIGKINTVEDLEKEIKRSYSYSPLQELKEASREDLLIEMEASRLLSGMFDDFQTSITFGKGSDWEAYETATASDVNKKNKKLLPTCEFIVNNQKLIIQKLAETKMITAGQAAALLASIILRMINKNNTKIMFSIRDYQMFTHVCREKSKNTRTEVLSLLGNVKEKNTKEVIPSHHATEFTISIPKIRKLIGGKTNEIMWNDDNIFSGVLFPAGDLHFRSPLWFSRNNSEGFTLDHRLAVLALYDNKIKSKAIKSLTEYGIKRAKAYSLISDIEEYANHEEVSLIQLFKEKKDREYIMISESAHVKALFAVGNQHSANIEHRIMIERTAFRYSRDKEVSPEVLALINDDIIDQREKELAKVTSYYLQRKNEILASRKERKRIQERQKARDLKEIAFYSEMTSMINLQEFRNVIRKENNDVYHSDIDQKLSTFLFNSKLKTRKRASSGYMNMCNSVLPTWNGTKLAIKWNSPFEFIQEFRSTVDYHYDIKKYPNFYEVFIMMPLFSNLNMDMKTMLSPDFWDMIRKTKWSIINGQAVFHNVHNTEEVNNIIKMNGIDYYSFIRTILTKLFESENIVYIMEKNARDNFTVLSSQYDAYKWVSSIKGYVKDKKIDEVSNINSDYLNLLDKNVIKLSLTNNLNIEYGFSDVADKSYTHIIYNEKRGK